MDQAQNTTPTPSPKPTTRNLHLFLGLLSLLLLCSTSLFAYQTIRLQNQLNELAASLSPTPTTEPTTTPVVDGTNSWQTYADSQNGYSLKHPGIKQSPYQEGNHKGISLVFTGPEQVSSGRTQTSLFDGYFIKTLVLPSASSLKDLADQSRKQNQKSIQEGDMPEISQISTITIDNQSVYTYSIVYKDNTTTLLFAPLKSGVLQITTFNVGKPEAIANYQKELNLILSTLKLSSPTISDETSSWQTFSNPTAGITLRYPQNWTFKNLLANLSPVPDYLKYTHLYLGFTPKSVGEDVMFILRAEPPQISQTKIIDDLINMMPNSTVTERKDIIFDGFPATKIVFENQAKIKSYNIVFINKSGLRYILTWSDSEKEISEKIVNSVLSEIPAD